MSVLEPTQNSLSNTPSLGRRILVATAAGSVGVIVLLVIWWLLARYATTLLPTPWQAMQANIDAILSPFHRRGPGDVGIGWLLLQSLQRVLAGYILGSLVAIPLGLAMGLSPLVMRMVYPVVQILRPVSPVAWLPIALAIFNMANPSAIFVIFICSLWPTLLNTAAGAASVSPDYIRVARVLGMPTHRLVLKIIIPATLPAIFTGLRISLGIAWLVIVAVEMLTGGQGLGFFIWDEWNRLNLSAVFLAILLIGLTGLALDAILARLQRMVQPWA